MLAERLLPRLENHLCGFQVASISCFAASPLDETAFKASSDSGNADRVDPARLPISRSREHIRKCSTEADYGSGILSLKPVG